MTDIETLGYPLVYKAATAAPSPAGLAVHPEEIALRTAVRALTGMQKEALVHVRPTGTVWRLVCDEGPYLNGTDLAPFPLAFYATGMVFSLADELLKHAAAAGITVRGLQITQDNFYTMEGSAIRGDMIGGALPTEITVEIDADGSTEAVQAIVTRAEQSSPAQFYMREVLANTFALSHNGAAAAVTGVNPSPKPLLADPAADFEAARPLPADQYLPEIITKIDAAETVFGVEGGAGSSLQATQKRTLHVRAICTLGEDGLKHAKIQLFKPLGSTFHFVGDDSGRERAPSSLVYLAAGVGFCFMTQIGRYAHIVKQDLRGYRIVQDTVYRVQGVGAAAEPVDTHTFLDMGEDGDAGRRTLSMSERTCFLHAAMRSATPSKVTLKHHA